MRVGIYNRWLATLGGGERHSLGIAELLSYRHSVSVISHAYVPRDLVAGRLNLDLSRVEFITIPDSNDISRLSAEYDLFVNASHMSFFPSRARRSALLIYFPAQVETERILQFRRRAGLMVKRLLMAPSFVEGVSSVRLVNGAYLFQFAPLLRIILPPSPSGYHVSFDLGARDSATYNVTIELDGNVVDTVRLLPGKDSVRCRIAVPAARSRRTHEMVIQAKRDESKHPFPSPLMTLTLFLVEDLRYYLFRLLVESTWGQGWAGRLLCLSVPTNAVLEAVDTYDAIWANSKFTRKWIERYWRRPSDVLYPPVDIENLRPASKINQILSVGRFFAGSHNKKHRVMIAAFKEMVDQGLSGWELHLVGGTGPRNEDEEYLQQVYQDARGYPVFIHPNIPFTDLVDLYGKSAIYWHASGFGEDEDAKPIKFEHFGLTTVEAMASGCVPVVIAKGGQPEIIKHQRNGFLWQTTAELQMFTWQLIRDNALRSSIASAAIHDSRLYDKAHFQSRVRELLSQIGLVV